MYPIVSACIIAYNNDQYISKCIEGALNQQVNFPYEIVISDDCSNDKTISICRRFQNIYPEKIRLHVNRKNLGLIGNWLNAIQSCNGKYIALCEGDDYWIDKLKIQKQVEYMVANPGTSLVHTDGYNLKNGILTQWKKWGPMQGDLKASAHLGVIAHTSATLFPRDLMEEFINKFYPYATDKEFMIADWPLFAYLSTKGNFGYLIDKTSVYRIHSTSVSNNSNKTYLFNYSSSIIKVKRFLRENVFTEENYPYFTEDVLSKDFSYLKLKYAFGTYNYKAAKTICSSKEELNDKAIRLSKYTIYLVVFYFACIYRKIKRIITNHGRII